MYQNDFPEELIKGRIAENVFELICRECLGFKFITKENS